jgi:hypothetical protein
MLQRSVFHQSTRSAPLLLMASLLLCLGAIPALATTYTWSNPSGGNWSDASSWTPNGVPSASGDVAVIPALSGAYTVALDVNPAISEVHVGSGPTLDLASYSLGSVGQVFNTGTVLNFRGVYDGTQFHNQTQGVIQVGANDSMVVNQSVTNDGTILIGPGLQNALFIGGSVTFSGSGAVLIGGSGRINCGLARPQTSTILSNAAGHTIGGAGDSWVPIRNYGVLLQDGSQGRLFTQHEYLYNYGTVRVSNAGINVDFPLVKSFGGKIVGTNGTFTVMMPYATGGPIDNLNGGSFVADGGDLLIGAGVIANGSVERTGGSGAVSIISVATPSSLVIQPGAELRVDGLMDVGVNGSTLENHGTIRVRGTFNVDGDATNSIALTGDGTLLMDGGTLGTPAGAVLTNSAGHTISGCGTITANIDNQGTINIDCGSGGETARNCTITNRHVIKVVSGDLFMSGATFNLRNYGTVQGGGGAMHLQAGATISNLGGSIIAGARDIFLGYGTPASSIVGGTLTAAGAGIFRNVRQVNLQGVTIGPSATFLTTSASTTNVIGANVINQGVNDIESGASFVVDPSVDYLQTAGTTMLKGGTLTVPRGFQVQGALTGTGTVVGTVTNLGLVSPDNATNGLKIQGDYHQLSAGQLSIGIAGSALNQFGHLNVTGNATLDGIVAVAATGGFVPATGQNFQVMAFASRSGQFSQMQSDPSLQMAPVYNPANIMLQTVSALGVIDGSIPAEVRFYSRGTGFGLELPQAAEVSVRAFDVTGREVAVLADGPRAAGIYHLQLANAGGTLPSGLYFARATLRMSKRSEVRTAKLAFVR